MASRREQWHRVLACGLVAVLGLGAVGCGEDADPADRGSTGDGASASDGDDGQSASASDDDSGCDIVGASSADPTTSVEISLTDYAVAAVPQEVPAGPTEMVVANDGRIWHELIVVRVDGESGALALDPFGGADETQIPEDDIVGKVREFLAGTTCTATFDLAPGSYALICNLVDDGSNPHYSQGMHTGFTVT
jgi:hypothetical protein